MPPCARQQQLPHPCQTATIGLHCHSGNRGPKLEPILGLQLARLHICLGTRQVLWLFICSLPLGGG